MPNNTSLKSTKSNFPPSWVETTLGEMVLDGILEKPLDGNHGNIHPKSEDFVSSGVPFIMASDLKNGKVDLVNCSFIRPEQAQTLKKGFAKNGDILLSHKATIGRTAIVKTQLEYVVLTPQVTYYRPKDKKKLSNVWLKYYFNSSDFQKTLNSFAGGGSTRAYIGITSQLDLPILIPPLPEQKAIASVLSAFDDKIELLREQNNILEELGQTIFKEWFGKYRVDDELPDGWRVFELTEIVDIINGYAYKGSDLIKDSKNALVTLKSFDRNGGFQTRGFKPFVGKPKETQEVKIGDLVVAHTDLTQDAEVLGNPAFIFYDGGFEKMFITMDLVKVVSKNKNITNAFLYYLMKTKEFKGHCVGYANGTTVLHLSKKAIPEYQIALPKNFEILSDVSLLLKETTDKIADNNSQIQSLARSRDVLLSRLMRGEVRVRF